MSKRSIVLAIVAAVLCAAAFFSLFYEKKQAETELDDLLNGKEPNEPDEPAEPAEPVEPVEPET